MRTTSLFLLSAMIAAPAFAQDVALATTPPTDSVKAESTTTAKKAAAASLVKKIEIQFIRPVDQRGVNVFEAPKTAAVPFDGVKMSFGAAFTQAFQGIRHENTADSVATSSTNPVNANRLIEIGNGANLATANL